MRLSNRVKTVYFILGVGLIQVSFFAILLELLFFESSLVKFLWSIFLKYAHIVFTGLALTRFKWNFNHKMFQPKTAFMFGSIFLTTAVIGWLAKIEVEFLNFRSLVIWSGLFLLLLYSCKKFRKLDSFWVVYLSFLTVFVATEVWEIPLYLRYAFISNPYHNSDWLYRFIILNSKLWSGILLLSLNLFHGWRPTKAFALALFLVLALYPAIIFTALGWTAWWYRLLYFPLCTTFITGPRND